MSRVLKYENIVLLPPAVPVAGEECPCAHGEAAPDNEEYPAGIVLDEAAAAIQDAEDEANAILMRAAEDGRAKGYKEGFRLAEEEIQKKLEEDLAGKDRELEAKAREIRTRFTKKRDEIEGTLVRRGFELAQRIITRRIREDDGACLSLIGVAAARLPETERATLKLGPRCYEAAGRHMDEIERMLAGVKSIEVTLFGTDDGCCVIETPFGSVDGSVSTQLARAIGELGQHGEEVSL